MQHKDNQENKKLLNSIVEVEIDGKMSLVSLYDDLPHFEYDLTIDNLKNLNTKLETCIQELKQRITKLENENSNLKKSNAVILKNITSLYKTACKEIQRKDNMINELRKRQFNAHHQQKSKMFSNYYKEEKSNPTEKLETKTHQNQIEGINNLTMNVQPDKNIPKTVYYKRLCQKFAMENKTNDLKNFKSKEENEIIMEKQNITDELGLKIHQKRIEEIYHPDKSKNVYANDDLKMDVQPDNNIPKTVCHERILQKFDKDNESLEFENKKEEKIDAITSDKKSLAFELEITTNQKRTKGIDYSSKHDNSIENNDLTIKLPPVNNTSKTVCCERLCKKFDEDNETIEFENKNTEEINKTTMDKIPACKLGIKTNQKQTEDNSNSSKHDNSIKNNYSTIKIHPMNNIPKTICCERSCKKFDEDNETIEFENKNAGEIEKIITDKNQACKLGIKTHKKRKEDINNSSKPENQIKIDDSLSVKTPPNNNITKIVSCERLCQKFEKGNETIEFKNKNTEEINKIITDETTGDNNEEHSHINKSIPENYNVTPLKSGTSFKSNDTDLSSVHFEVEHSTLFRSFKNRKVIMRSTSDHKPITRKGRRVQLITINNSQPLPSFNGAKKTEIDLSKKSIHIEKEVESSSLFYIPSVKKRRTMNFGDCNS